MEIPLNAAVKCADRDCGESTHVVLNPLKRSLTHLVVRPSSGDKTPRLIPVDTVIESREDEIRLRCTREELDSMPEFDEDVFVHPENNGLKGHLMFPYAFAEDPATEPDGRHMAPSDLAIRRGATVEATDGDVGSVSEFLVDPVHGDITHLILSAGHPWSRRDVTIPLDNVAVMEQDRVRLDMTKEEVGRLPSLRVRRWLPTGD